MAKIDELKEMLEIAKELAKLEEELKAREAAAKKADEADKSEEDDEIDRQFADTCSMTITVVKDKETKGSMVEVKFSGVEGKPDLMMIGVSAMSAIADHFPKKKVETLAAICTLALTGEGNGIHRLDSIIGDEEED